MSDNPQSNHGSPSREHENAQLRVLFIIDWFFYYAAPIAIALAENADVRCVLRDHGTELGLPRSAVAEKSAILGSVPANFVPGKQFDLRSIGAVLRAIWKIRKFQPDVVHTQWHSDWRLLLLSLATPRAVRVLTVHDVNPHPGAQFHTGAFKRLIRWFLYKSTDAFVVHGDTLVPQLRRDSRVRDSAHVGVIAHGSLAQPSASSELPHNRSLLFFGRWEYYKGLDLLIPAVESASEALGDLQLIIAGQGSEGTRARALVRKPDLFEWREGFVNDQDLPGLFGSTSVIVLPYREASQSGVVPLAFANRRPVIATNVGALGQAVHDGVNGLLVDEPSVEALRDGIIRIFSEPCLLEKLADGARCTAATALSPAAIARAHRSLYDVARSAKRGRQPKVKCHNVWHHRDSSK